jgi:hypothetical protein
MIFKNVCSMIGAFAFELRIEPFPTLHMSIKIKL